MAQRIVDGKFKPHTHYKSGYFITAKNPKGKLWYRSSYELSALEKLEADRDVTFIDVEPFRIPYKHKGGTHNYVPDILFERRDGTRTLVEVKPECFVGDEDVVAKTKAAIEHCRREGMAWEMWAA